MRPGRGQAILLLAIVGVTLIMWVIAFWVTGLLWWRSPATAREARPLPVPPPEKLSTDWVDLREYATSRPEWRP